MNPHHESPTVHSLHEASILVVHSWQVWTNDKKSAYNAGVAGSIPGSGRSPGEENGNLLPYSCLENPWNRVAWWATVHGVTKSQD